MHDKFKEVTVSSEFIFKGNIISLQVDQVTLPNGDAASREIVRHSGAVAVLALLDDRMIVVEQYRKAAERSMIEIPAGKLDEGEQPLAAAARELQEETGYTCENLKLIGSFYTAPGFCDELIHLYLAEQLQAGEMRLDEDEFLSCDAITLEQAQQYMQSGAICDAKTMIAVYAWQIYRLTGRI